MAIYDETGSGGIFTDGTAARQASYVVRGAGGVDLNGSAKKEDPVYHYPNSPNLNQNLSFGGHATSRVGYRTVGSGGVKAIGKALPRTSYKFVSDGRNPNTPPNFTSFSFGYLNSLNPTEANVTVFASWDFTWRNNQLLQLSWDFTWNSGRQRQYWYRIVGAPKDNVCPPIQTPDSCCRQFVMNVHASSIEDLCLKLQQRNWQWPIQSVQKFSKPAQNAAVAEDAADGITYDCNTAEIIEVCDHPACLAFCIDFDIFESWGATIIASVVVDFSYVASGSLTVAGTAPAEKGLRTAHYSYTASGGLGVQSDAEFESSGYAYVGSGELSLGGTSDLRASHWTFSGGNWPSFSPTRFGRLAEQLAETDEDAPWVFPERVFYPDSNFTLVDLSFAENSVFLIVRGFDLNIPEDSTILGISVDIRRYTNSLVIDNEVYLLMGDDIVSDNKVNHATWPIGSPSTFTYGGQFDTWRDPSNPDFLGPWDADDLNSPNFGIALRVRTPLNAFGVIAYVDFMDVNVTYQSAQNQTLHFSGQADVKSSHYSHVAAGGLQLQGNAGLRIGRRFTQLGRNAVGLPAFKFGGNYALNFRHIATGGLTTSGNANSTSSAYHYMASGGLGVGGSCSTRSSNYTWAASGGLTASGKSLLKATYRAAASGELSLGGSSDPSSNRSYTATGGFTLGGSSATQSTSYRWVASGGFSFSGEGQGQGSDFGILSTSGGGFAEVENVTVVFGTQSSSNTPITPARANLTECDCTGMPLSIQCSHNIVASNKLSQFAARNNITIPTRFNLLYNAANDSWQANYHYTGLSSVSNRRETWNLVFQLQCTNVVGGISIGQNVWKTAVLITQKNLSTMQTLETRVVLGFLPDPMCNQSSGFRAKAHLDTQSQFVTLTPASTVYQIVLFDQIGLFKTSFWLSNPTLEINISQAGLPTFPPRFPLVGT